jgi:hypothetical protein
MTSIHRDPIEGIPMRRGPCWPPAKRVALLLLGGLLVAIVGCTANGIGSSELLGTRHQRDVLAVDTELPVAHIQVRAYTIGR